MSESVKLPEGQPERRRVPRAALRLNATIREPGRSRAGVKVIDISTHGCRIEAISGATTDSWVLLTIAGLETQYSRVAWSCHEFAGLEFATPLGGYRARSAAEGRTSCRRNRSPSCATSRPVRTGSRPTMARATSLTDLSRKCAVDAVVEGLKLRRFEASAPTQSEPALGCAGRPLRIAANPPSAWMRSASEPRGRSDFRAQARTASSCPIIEFVAHALKGEPNHRFHRRSELDFQPARFDQLEVFLGIVLGIEREIIGRAKPFIKRHIAAQLGLAGLVGLGLDVCQLTLHWSLH